MNKGGCTMTTAAATATPIAWWKEPTKDQWYAYLAAWAGWTLDAFDLTAFLLVIAPIAKEFGVPVPAVAAVLTITLWMRLMGGPSAGQFGGLVEKVGVGETTVGRKIETEVPSPLLLSIATCPPD